MTAQDSSIDDEQLTQFMLASEKAARLGGEVLMKWLGKAKVYEKGPGDLVTQADFESQQVIREFLLGEFPDHHFLGEESETDSDDTSKAQSSTPEQNETKKPSRFPARQPDFCWIVDPLDGTTNFVHQLRSFSVSVALRWRDDVVVGCVFDPTTDECFSAAIGRGATLNGSPIESSQCTEIEKSLAVFSMNSHISADDPQMIRFVNVMKNAATLRRLGSAALNLCFVACGRVDAYWATSLKIWDVAAGFLIAQEAGAVIDDFEGEPLSIGQPRFCATGTEELFDSYKKLLNV